jgi:lysophospholipase L1-like esterase
VDLWEPFRFFEGNWTGEESGKAGIGKGEREIQFIMDDRYLFYRNISHFEPQKKNPKGETHEDWTFFSYDNNRRNFVQRVFHSEGYVNQYILDTLSSNQTRFVFVSESVENAPVGLRARVTYSILGKNTFKETFELAMPGKDFSILLENIWTRNIDPDPERFREEIETFKWNDKKNYLPEEAVLFVGSSSIRLWETTKYFPGYPIINRGFGGAHISDVNYYIETIVLKYKPKVILFYAGDNDVAAGKDADRVVEDYIDFVSSVTNRLPETNIIFIPIKPSLSRWSFWETMELANNKISEYCATKDNLYYVDTALPMLSEEGTPASALFVSDGLHLSAEGYELWTRILKPVLEEVYEE